LLFAVNLIFVTQCAGHKTENFGSAKHCSEEWKCQWCWKRHLYYIVTIANLHRVRAAVIRVSRLVERILHQNSSWCS